MSKSKEPKKPKLAKRLISEIETRIDYETGPDSSKFDEMLERVAAELGSKFAEDLHWEAISMMDEAVRRAFQLGWRYSKNPEELIFSNGVTYG